jgi:hypothetical protein
MTSQKIAFASGYQKLPSPVDFMKNSNNQRAPGASQGPAPAGVAYANNPHSTVSYANNPNAGNTPSAARPAGSNHAYALTPSGTPNGYAKSPR